MAQDVVYIGNKPVMNYVLAIVTQFNGGSRDVAIKARGKAISRAVDAAEVVRKKFLTDVEVDDIQIGTEEIEDDEGEKTSISSIEIYLTRPAE